MRYAELKRNLSAPARRVVEELIDTGRAPEDVLRRVARELHDEPAAYAYVREVLYRSLIELIDAPVTVPLRHFRPVPGHAVPPVAAG